MSAPNLSPEACAEIRKTVTNCTGTRAAADIQHAGHYGHPILETVDALLRAAKVYQQRFDAPIAEDSVLGPYWLDAIKNARRLLDGDFGPVDSGTVEQIFWRAVDIAGFTEADV